jgi:hypothetical protein
MTWHLLLYGFTMRRATLITLAVLFPVVGTCPPTPAGDDSPEAKAIRALRTLHADVTTHHTDSGNHAIDVSLLHTLSDGHSTKYYAPLADLPYLQRVELWGDAVQNDALRYLSGLQKLESIALTRASIDDNGLELLARHRGLRELTLWQCYEISDRGIRRLGRLSNLEIWVLKETRRITGASLIVARRMTKLRALGLDGSSITDDGIQALGPHPSLEYLSLEMTLITDQSLEYIKRMPKLKHLDVMNTRVTEEGVDALRKARPDLDIDSGQSPPVSPG